jgi:hypothetical protein
MPFSLKRSAPTTASIGCRVPVALTVLTLACVSSASAQQVTTVEELNLQQTVVQLVNPPGSAPVGQAIALATALEIGTAPFGTSSGGFVFKLDPSTGLLARTTTTFGPSFAERALTSGEGKVSVGATFSASTYDKLNDFSLGTLPLGTITASSPTLARTGKANLQLTSKTIAMSGTVGVTDNLDVGVVVPMVSIKLTGTSAFVRGDGAVPRLAETTGIFSGIGDVSALAKYRFVKFKGPDLPDPGGVALIVNMRLPTGSRDDLRGLGVTRTMVGGVVSAGKGRLRPHGNVGFEYWNKAVDAAPIAGSARVAVRHQLLYAAGIELEATPKVTFLVDFLGQHIGGGGQVGLVADTVGGGSGITSSESLITLAEGIRKALLVPGMKVNLKGKLLLSLNALITMSNNGLHPKVTPVVGLNLAM